MKKALLYSRVSTSEQSERGHSLAEQERTLRRHCEREGIKPLAHFTDDCSGKTCSPTRRTIPRISCSLSSGAASAAIMRARWG
jgi:DNA invertase Pin-like site-specific DNA recombinase